jgi:hypothetical protein
VFRQVSSQLADFFRLGPTPASSDQVGRSAVDRRVVVQTVFESMLANQAVACPDLSIRERPENQ